MSQKLIEALIRRKVKLEERIVKNENTRDFPGMEAADYHCKALAELQEQLYILDSFIHLALNP